MVSNTGPKPASTPARSVFDHTADSLKEYLNDRGEPAFRAGQILEWIYGRGATSYDEMTNLSLPLRSGLADDLALYASTVSRRHTSSDGTIKMLLTWRDGATSECVLMPDGARRTACVSTQVGCPVGCVFCASGLDGLQRQLSAGQIVEQAMRIRSLCGDVRLSNVVFMGLGEPLANYSATVQALRTINAAWGMNIGARKITVSTVGLPKQMRRLADEGMQVTLALSLHAPNDALRRKLIPWAEHVTIASLVDAAVYYFDRSGREVTIEYILLGGVNDSIDDARDLVRIARRMRSHVNLIAYNPVEGLPYQRPKKDFVHRFLHELRSRGVNAHVRQSRGLDIDAACGQLRRQVREQMILSS